MPAPIAHAPFLLGLSSLFATHASSGAVTVTITRHVPRPSPLPGAPAPVPVALFRVKGRARSSHIATEVTMAELPAFHAEYVRLLKQGSSGPHGLVKKERSSRKKKAAAGAGEVVDGGAAVVAAAGAPAAVVAPASAGKGKRK